MTRLVEIHTPEELAGFGPSPGVLPLAPESFLTEAPDAHWTLTADELVRARCSLWWKRVPPYGQQSLGLIGHFAAAESPSAVDLLNHVSRQLAARGCTMAVGPMDGNTWHRYRFVTERGSEPPFFLEPDNPDEWPRYFAAAGFAPIATYTSALNRDLARVDARLPSLLEKIAGLGVSLRQAKASQMEDELHRVHAMSLLSFERNFLYTPLGEPEFLGQYRKILPYVLPELVFIAERKAQPVGFLFAIPDLLRPQRQEANDTIIIKTVAVVPDCSALGLGTLLVARAEQRAYELGFRRAIHALMHESNRSRTISGHRAVTMRRYALYARSLLP